MAKQFRGSYTVTITPFTADGRKIDIPAWKRFVDWQIAVGVPGIIILGLRFIVVFEQFFVFFLHGVVWIGDGELDARGLDDEVAQRGRLVCGPRRARCRMRWFPWPQPPGSPGWRPTSSFWPARSAPHSDAMAKAISTIRNSCMPPTA